MKNKKMGDREDGEREREREREQERENKNENKNPQLIGLHARVAHAHQAGTVQHLRSSLHRNRVRPPEQKDAVSSILPLCPQCAFPSSRACAYTCCTCVAAVIMHDPPPWGPFQVVTYPARSWRREENQIRRGARKDAAEDSTNGAIARVYREGRDRKSVV